MWTAPDVVQAAALEDGDLRAYVVVGQTDHRAHQLEKGAVTLGNYQEVRIRHFHQTLDKYLSA